MALKVLRVYHAGRDASHRMRERALASSGAEITLVVPRDWPDSGAERQLTLEPFPMIELDTRRSGDVNRHAYASAGALRDVIAQTKPDLLDLHEEPFSLATRQWLSAAHGLPVVSYSAQNVDKRFPPPFAQYEVSALARLNGMYPCSRQAASVARGKGFAGLIEILPLGRDGDRYQPGDQSVADSEIVLGLVGRFVPEKGVLDAVRVLSRLRESREAKLVLVGSGPEEGPARALAAELGVATSLEVLPWQDGPSLAELYRTFHVALILSRATETWTEQFGRVIVEAQASGAIVAGYASGSIPEVMAGAGLLVAEGDVRGLGTQLVALLDDPARNAVLRDAGLNNVAGMTWAEVARRQIAFYQQVLRGPAQGRPVGRQAATAEFGAPATLHGGVARPFALPVLRRDTPWTRALGSTIDWASHRS